MNKVLATKMKMSQIWKDDAVIPVSPVKLTDGAQIEDFKEGDLVKVVGTTKSKGFQGVVKRHGFKGGPKTHGQKNRHRAPGSIGSTDPQRVVPGKKMAGRMGGKRKSVYRLEVVSIDKDKATILIRGSVPGNTKGKLEIIKL